MTYRIKVKIKGVSIHVVGTNKRTVRRKAKAMFYLWGLPGDEMSDLEIITPEKDERGKQGRNYSPQPSWTSL